MAPQERRHRRAAARPREAEPLAIAFRCTTVGIPRELETGVAALRPPRPRCRRASHWAFWTLRDLPHGRKVARAVSGSQPARRAAAARAEFRSDRFTASSLRSGCFTIPGRCERSVGHRVGLVGRSISVSASSPADVHRRATARAGRRSSRPRSGSSGRAGAQERQRHVNGVEPVLARDAGRRRRREDPVGDAPAEVGVKLRRDPSGMVPSWYLPERSPAASGENARSVMSSCTESSAMSVS